MNGLKWTVMLYKLKFFCQKPSKVEKVAFDNKNWQKQKADRVSCIVRRKKNNLSACQFWNLSRLIHWFHNRQKIIVCVELKLFLKCSVTAKLFKEIMLENESNFQLIHLWLVRYVLSRRKRQYNNWN
jgi:CRISPR/Cas system CMR-associated protein Cmr5 small subunit